MRLVSISIRNLKRRKKRAAFLTLGLLIGIATIVTLLSISRAMRLDIDTRLDEYGANIMITPKPKTLPLTYGDLTVPGFSAEPGMIDEKQMATIRQIQANGTINTVAPKLLEPIQASGHKILLLGVRFPEELKMKKWWKLTGQRPAAKDDLLIGSTVARMLKKEPGDSLEIKGKPFRISAVLEPMGSQEDNLIFADLRQIQALFGKQGKVSMVEVSAWCQTHPIERIQAQIGAKLPWTKVSAFKQAVKSKANTLQIIDKFSAGFLVLLLVIGSLVVLTTMMASVNQRTKEIGVFRAIGFRQSQVMKIIMFEAFLVSLTSGVLGWLVGFAVTEAVVPKMTGPRVGVTADPVLALTAIGLSVVMGLAASYYPARKASRFDPVEALRSL